MTEPFELDRLRFAARLVEDWIKDYGKERAEEMVALGLMRNFYSPLTRSLLETAWGR